MDWIRVEQGLISEPILEYLEKLIISEKKKGEKIRICVGTDAQRRGRSSSHKFVTVIALVSEGHGGMLMYTVSMERHKITLNEKLLTEVQKSIEVAYMINPLLEKHGVSLEVHVDINSDPKWASNKSMSQALGYIKGMGYDYQFKPNAWASSFCADRFAKR